MKYRKENRVLTGGLNSYKVFYYQFYSRRTYRRMSLLNS